MFELLAWPITNIPGCSWVQRVHGFMGSFQGLSNPRFSLLARYGLTTGGPASWLALLRHTTTIVRLIQPVPSSLSAKPPTLLISLVSFHHEHDWFAGTQDTTPPAASQMQSIFSCKAKPRVVAVPKQWEA